MGALSRKGTRVNKVIRKELSVYKGEMGESIGGAKQNADSLRWERATGAWMANSQ